MVNVHLKLDGIREFYRVGSLSQRDRNVLEIHFANIQCVYSSSLKLNPLLTKHEIGVTRQFQNGEQVFLSVLL